MQTLISMAKKERSEDKPTAFIAMGEIALAVKGNIGPYLEKIVPIIKATLNAKNRSYCPQSLTCVSMISSVAGPALQKDMHEILGMAPCPPC